MDWKDRCPGWVHDENNIKGFFGDYRWLSNFHLCPVPYEGLTYPSSENAYQAAKSTEGSIRDLFLNVSPSQSKYKGQKLHIREDWEQVKLQVMFDILESKFHYNPELKLALLSTDLKYLEETNWWNDKFWGVCRDEGLNHLGRILMVIRESLKS